MLVVDHYALDSFWHKTLRVKARRIMVIDDLSDRAFDADVFLNQNLIAAGSLYDDLLPVRCKKLFGPQFALLRPEFREARQTLKHRDGAVKRVFVFFGGVDANNELEKTLSALEPFGGEGLKVDAGLGTSNSKAGGIQNCWGNRSWLEFEEQVGKIAGLMKQAGLGFGAFAK